MKYLHLNTLLLLSLCLLLHNCTSPSPLEVLEQDIKEELAKVDGIFGVAFKNLSTGEEILISARDSFHAASTMKTPVMIELYKQAVAGKFKLTDSIEIKNEFKSIVDGSPYSMSIDDDSEGKLY